MSDYKEKFEQWQKTAKEKIEEIDEQIRLREKIEESTKVLLDTAQKGAETLREGVDRLKQEAEKSEVGKQAVKVVEEVAKTASETAKSAWELSKPFRKAAEEATEKAGEVFGSATERAGEIFDKTKDGFERTASKISKTVDLGMNWTQAFDSVLKSTQKTAEWIKENPFEATLTGASILIGAGLGAGMTLISSHWLFNSALPAWSVKQVSERFIEYLEDQEDLIRKGNLPEAEKERVKFEQEIVKYVGAPLLAGFSCGAGAMMMINVLSPKRITGAPISWVLRGNPVLEGIWFFSNGLVCFKIGYEFFMISLKNQEEVENLIRQIRGLLPTS
ncbi:MAG: hypothetical protein D6735_16075 [Acidobacteria bacterium]|nr:MAG: hypothetical protein D6735_16075 [Acidobacteriota bacterium]